MSNDSRFVTCKSWRIAVANFRVVCRYRQIILDCFFANFFYQPWDNE